MATLTIEIGKLGAKGTMSVNLLVCQAKTKKRIKTGIKLEREEVTASGKIKNRQKAMALEQIRRRYEDKMESLRASILDWSSMDASTLVELLTTSKRSNEPELFEFVGDWMENANIKGAKNYKTMLAKIREYTKCGSLLFSKINYEFLLGF